MTLIDFKCEACGHTWEHLFRAHKDIVNEMQCVDCLGKARRLWNTTNFIHTSHSSMYGKFEPCFGEVVRDYGHKKQLLKRYGAQEASDRTGGSNCYRQSADSQRKAQAQIRKESQASWKALADLQ